MTEAHCRPLQTIIDEFKNISPEITAAVIFKKTGETVAASGNTNQTQIKNLFANVDNITAQEETLDGIENLTIQTSDNQLSVTATNNHFIATVATRASGSKIVESLTHVVIPAVVGLVEKVGSEPLESQPVRIKEIAPEEVQDDVSVEDATELQTEQVSKPGAMFEPLLPSPPINQLMVEKIGGLLVPSDTVRIDCDIIEKWSDLYEGKKICIVNIETLEGKTVTCKFKAIKEAKPNGQGIIQIPERILGALQTGKGSLVMVKPVIE